MKESIWKQYIISEHELLEKFGFKSDFTGTNYRIIYPSGLMSDIVIRIKQEDCKTKEASGST